ncbi:NUDIX hydrolase [Pararhodobacter zhoushanensis]|uniref:NUDIX hydrolase n=1 Tax=Pararhodobacter zhoushanensis TaxID=2479545 RepID=A0ABT3GUI2_9RHOB|nr:NUDIX hydrolase [Pararhodobacter zhoushanensis]MCW1931211.1 NUDIX hydrolase [Pararhodobacter zhoushanensis]
MNPRFGTPPERGRRYIRRPGAYAVLWRDGQILVTHQAAPQPEFQLPGGGVEAGESPIQALHREVFEETGWRIAAPRRLGTFRRFTFMPEYDLWAEKLCMIYLAFPVRRLSAPTEPGHSAHWLDPREAVGLLGNPGDAAFVRGLIG